MNSLPLFIFFLLFDIYSSTYLETDFCNIHDIDNSCQILTSKNKNKYLLYDVNPGEGFNLRRDVYLRIATLVKKLNEAQHDEWILVLPPWGPLYHWKSRNLDYQANIKWSKFFDLQHLNEYVPVIELEEFLKSHGPKINELFYLQNYEEGWNNGEWEERIDIRKCMNSPPYQKTKDHKYIGWFWSYEDIIADNFRCLSMQGYSSTLKNYLLTYNSSVVMIDRAEVILHDNYGDAEYWKVRRSVVFAKNLIEIGNEYRKTHLNSTDVNDKTEGKYASLSAKVHRTAVGGPYLAAHLRRQDFIKARPYDVPNIKHTAEQLLELMHKLNLDILYVATDAIEPEFNQLQKLIPTAKRFVPSEEIKNTILDGGIAIVDQWICSHARYFIGTYESTFSFRIQEEREILGFKPETTFNRLCGNNQKTCTQPSKWLIV